MLPLLALVQPGLWLRLRAWRTGLSLLLSALLPLLLLPLALGGRSRPAPAPVPLGLAPSRASRARATAVSLLLLLLLLLLPSRNTMPMLAVPPAHRVAQGVAAPGGVCPIAGPVPADVVPPDGLAELLLVVSWHLGPSLSLGLIHHPTHSAPS